METIIGGMMGIAIVFFTTTYMRSCDVAFEKKQKIHQSICDKKCRHHPYTLIDDDRCLCDFSKEYK